MTLHENDVWKIVEKLGVKPKSDAEEDHERLVAALSKLSDQDLVEYEKIMHSLQELAYSRKLWLAGDFLLGEHSTDDTFDYAVNRLIYLGNEIFYKAIKDPDSLADLAEFETAEQLMYAPDDVWTSRHPEDFCIPTEKTGPRILKDEPVSDEEIQDLDSKLSELYPRLFKKYGLPQASRLPQEPFELYGYIEPD